MASRHPEHLESFSYIGPYRYHLRFCTDAKRPVFTSDAPVELVLAQILRACEEHEFAVIAYCFMPDHVHLLIEGTAPTSDCKRFIARVKQYSGYQHAAIFKERLWQRYGFERVLRDHETTFVVARYILENPIRAGLVTRVEDYPYVGSLVYTLRELLDSCQCPE
jgi:putative transposase